MNAMPKLTSIITATVLAAGLTASAQTLVHRYSFSDPAGSSTFSDSISSSPQTGSLNNNASSNPNSASLDGSQLQLDGTGGYAVLPAGMISPYQQVTIEFWASYNSNPAWTRTFAFGDQVSSGEDTGLDYTHFAGGNFQNLNYQTNGSSTYVNNNAGLDGQKNVHVTVVVDPTHNQLYYYNGGVIKSSPLNGANNIFPLSALNDSFGLIGRSLFDVDPTLNGSLDEFRVYSGVVSTSQVILNDAAGPNNLVTNAGTLNSVSLTSSAGAVTLGGGVQLAFAGNFANVSNVDLIAYGNATSNSVVFGSASTNVASVSSSGAVTALSQGSALITASYGGKSSSVTITVVSLPAPLAHRYSFSTDASDSIGGANGTLNGAASVSGGQVVLTGGSDYVSFPGNVINIATNTAISIDLWATYGGGTTWARVWEFGTGINNNNNVYSSPQVPDGGTFTSWPVSENFGGGSQTIVYGIRPLTNLTLHTTVVISPQTSTLSVYTNGVLFYSLYNATASLAGIATNSATLGFSSAGDPGWVGSIDEYRIYNGALTGPEIQLIQQNGSSSTNRTPGALQSLHVSAATYPAYAGEIAPVILANYANLAGFNLLPTVTASALGLTVTSSDTNIITVFGNNMIRTLQPGTVTLSASYQGLTNSAVVTVKNLSTLTHRYSFTSDASDSVGGANGTLNGNATVSGNALQLDSSTSSYLDLPPGLLSGYPAATIDAWATFNNTPNWARLWFFGDQQANEFYFAPVVNGASGHRYSAGFVHDGANFDVAPPFVTNSVHVTCIIGNGSFEIWTNGILQTANDAYIGDLSEVGTTFSRLGFSPYGDPGCAASVDEFRIYNGRLSPAEIAASDILGPNQLLNGAVATLKVTRSGSNIVVTWPLADAGFTLQSRATLTTGAWSNVTNTPTASGTNSFQVTLPSTGGSSFFRLSK